MLNVDIGTGRTKKRVVFGLNWGGVDDLDIPIREKLSLSEKIQVLGLRKDIPSPTLFSIQNYASQNGYTAVAISSNTAEVSVGFPPPSIKFNQGSISAALILADKIKHGVILSRFKAEKVIYALFLSEGAPLPDGEWLLQSDTDEQIESSLAAISGRIEELFSVLGNGYPVYAEKNIADIFSIHNGIATQEIEIGTVIGSAKPKANERLIQISKQAKSKNLTLGIIALGLGALVAIDKSPDLLKFISKEDQQKIAPVIAKGPTPLEIYQKNLATSLAGIGESPQTLLTIYEGLKKYDLAQGHWSATTIECNSGMCDVTWKRGKGGLPSELPANAVITPLQQAMTHIRYQSKKAAVGQNAGTPDFKPSPDAYESKLQTNIYPLLMQLNDTGWQISTQASNDFAAAPPPGIPKLKVMTVMAKGKTYGKDIPILLETFAKMPENVSIDKFFYSRGKTAVDDSMDISARIIYVSGK